MGGSTSHKRRKGRTRRHHHGSPPRDTNTSRVFSYEDHAITTGVGYEMLSRFGWKDGTSLGPPSQRAAATKPIPIVVRHGRAGIGCAITPESPASVGTPVDKNDDVFDPLRPRCRFDTTHVVRSLKALQKHEASCAANPNRSRSKRPLAASAPRPAPATTGWTPVYYGDELAASDGDFSELASLILDDDDDHSESESE